MPYSSDSDLELIWQDMGALPLPLVSQAQEAERVINTMLRRRGVTDLEISQLSAKTRADLKVPSCHYVLYLTFGSIAGEAALAMKEAQLKDFHRTFELAEVWPSGASTSSPNYASSGFLSMG